MEIRDISVYKDVKFIVDEFYGKIRKDKLLADIFNDVIQDGWPEHLEKMYRFWQTILLQIRTYSGKPFVPHMHLPVYEEHFQRWLSLWFETLDENFEGPKVDLAKWQANRMAEMFQIKIEYVRENMI